MPLTCRYCGQHMTNAWEETLCGNNPNSPMRLLQRARKLEEKLPKSEVQDALRIEELEYEVGHLKEVLRRIIGYVDSVRSSIT